MTLSKKLTKNKAFEMNLIFWKNSSDIFKLLLNFTHKCDHSGFRFDFELLGVAFNFTIYDIRHWNYEENRFYGEKEFEKAMKELYE